MNTQELIENEFKKSNFSEINLHKIFGSFIKNHKIICNEKNRMQYNKMFTSNSFINSLDDFLEKNNTLFEYSYVNEGYYQTVKINNINTNESLEIIYKYDSSKKDTTYQIYYQDNISIIQNIYFSTVLNSDIIIGLNNQFDFKIVSRTHIKENSNTINKYITQAYNNLQKTLEIDNILKMISNAIFKNEPLEDILDLLSIQNDLFDENFKKNVIYYFKEIDIITQHNELITELKTLEKVKNNNIKIK